MLLVDSGGSFSDEKSAHGRVRADAAVKNHWVVKASDLFAVDAANLSETDLPYVSGLLAKTGFEQRAKEQPFLKRLISANLVVDLDTVAPASFVLREVRRRDSGPARVAFVGLSKAGTPDLAAAHLVDPIGTAKKVIPRAKAQSDLVVVLLHGGTDDALQLAKEVSGIDVIIAGTGQLFTPPVKVGETFIVFTPFETRILGELRFYREGGKFLIKDRYISLDDGIPDDPEGLKVQTTQHDEWSAAAARSRAQLFDSQSSRTYNLGGNPKAEPVKGHISAQGCASCHASQYIIWANSVHAKATATMNAKPFETDPTCFSCHSTGSHDNGAPLLQNVQCESCHGPGADHAAKPAKGYGRIALETTCLRCHTSVTSPKFNLDSYWTRIKH